MNEKQIKFMATEDVQEFVNAAGKCDFEIDVLHQKIMIDAKSLLGVLHLGLFRVLTVQYSGYNATFENVIRKYAVA